MLSADTAVHILSTLHEAHTGHPPTVRSATAQTIPLAAGRTVDAAPTPRAEPLTSSTAAAASTGASARKAGLCVLGAPHIEDITQPGRDLRSKARELAVFLACHPDGASTREVGEYLEPDARLSQADQRVHTNASNLRHVLARAGGADAKAAYVIKSAGRYRLDPATHDKSDEQADLTPAAAMRRFWDREIANGRVPTGAELSRAAGVPPATGLGRRKRREWVAELPEDLTTPTGNSR